MTTNNVIFTPIPPDILTQVTDHVNQIEILLQPFLHALSPDERREIPKMADKTVAFVNKALEFAATNAQFSPPYLDVVALGNNVEVVGELNSIENPINSLAMQLNDTVMLAGSEAYLAALMFYNSVKEASRRNVPGAKAIFDDLKTRFELSRRPKADAVAKTGQAA